MDYTGMSGTGGGKILLYSVMLYETGTFLFAIILVAPLKKT